MRHQHAFRKFQKSPAHRRAMFRNMATSLLREERIETTVEKAKELRRVVEPLITLAGDDTLHARRQALSYLLDKKVVHKLFADLGPRFKARPGGYTRIVRTRHRAGDAAELAMMELLAGEAPASTEAAAPKKASAAKKKAAPKKEAGAAEA
jgi:large subunit ribosomal protein L17